MPSPTRASFIARWGAASGTERANHQLFVTELRALLDVPQPDPTRNGSRDNAYVLERRVTPAHGDGDTSSGPRLLPARSSFSSVL